MADTQQTDHAQPVCKTPQPAWEAKQYEEALAHLEKLQEQIDAMRRTVPSIIEPMARPVKDKAQLFVQVKTAAVQAMNDIQELRSSWTSQESQEMIIKSRESLQKDSDLSKAANIPHYGWTEDAEMG